VVVRESPQAQASRALANLEAAEAKRKAAPQSAPSASLPVQARKAATRAPATRSTTPAATRAAQAQEHQFNLQDAVAKMELAYVQCRDFGHSWRPYSARWLQAYNSYESQLQCQRCKTVRTRFLSATGSQLSGGYDYADGYLVKGMGRLTGSDRDVIRLASITALVQADTAND